MRVVAVVQARMGSTRLPGKVLKNILGKPVLWHIVNRVQKAKHVNEVVIAATTSPEDEKLEKFAADCSLGIYRGSVNDIVDRFLGAGKKFQADVVVRVWGDCPFVDPEIIDKMLSKFINGNYDYANNANPATYPPGMDIELYSMKSLERIQQETLEPFYREYPFEHVYKRGDSFKTFYDKNDIDLSHINLTVDYIEDFRLATEIYKCLYKDGEVFHLGQILNLMEKHPELKEMNSGLPRNIEFNRDKKKIRQKSG